MLKSLVQKSFRAIGLDVRRIRDENSDFPPDFLPDESAIIRQVKPWTMTSPERLYALIQAVRYLCANAIPGAIVECGVWKGGSMAAVARALLLAGDTQRHLYLFDTFAGMPDPTANDLDYAGKRASTVMRENPNYKCDDAPVEIAKSVLYATGYPKDKIHFVPGNVEQTVPAAAPDAIALLRLDTDWHASTRHELEHLFPRLVSHGVLIVDDYGHWRGSRRACDDYFAERRVPILLNRIDYTGRMALKP
jgi:hypothetical protein